MAKNLSTGSHVLYHGPLPEGWGPAGRVVAVDDDDVSGDQIFTVEFDPSGGVIHVYADQLEYDPETAQYFDEDGIPFE